MSLSLSTLRQGISTKISEISGFKLSKHSPEFFARTENTVAHLAYTVGLNSSTATEERQRRSVGVYIQTPVTVIFSYRLRPLDIYPTDYDLAMDKEEQVIQKVLESYVSDNQFTIRYVSSTREVTDSQEYIIITIEFTTLHTI